MSEFANLTAARPAPGGDSTPSDGGVLTCYARPHRGRSLLVVIALRPEDERGWEILNELPQRIEKQSVEETPAGSRRYHLVGEHLDLDSLDPELDRIRPELAQSHQGVPRVRFLTQPD